MTAHLPPLASWPGRRPRPPGAVPHRVPCCARRSSGSSRSASCAPARCLGRQRRRCCGGGCGRDGRTRWAGQRRGACNVRGLITSRRGRRAGPGRGARGTGRAGECAARRGSGARAARAAHPHAGGRRSAGHRSGRHVGLREAVCNPGRVVGAQGGGGVKGGVGVATQGRWSSWELTAGLFSGVETNRHLRPAFA